MVVVENDVRVVDKEQVEAEVELRTREEDYLCLFVSSPSE